MKSLIIILSVSTALLSSCSVYRSGQTPDDVYYSPAPARASSSEYVQVDNQGDGRYNASAYDQNTSYDDQWLRMRVRNRSRWSAFDDYYYNDFGYSPMGMGGGGFGFGYNPIGFGGMGMGLGLGFGGYNNFAMNPYGYSPYHNYYNSYMNWNSFYNPYYPTVVFANPKTNPAGYTRLRNFNPSGYTNNSYNNSRNLSNRARPALRPPVNTTSSSSGTLGNSFKRVFSGNNSNANRSRDSYIAPSSQRPVRSYNPSNNNNNNYNRPAPTNTIRSNSAGSSSPGSSSGGGVGGRPSRR